MEDTLNNVGGGGDPVGEFQNLGMGILRISWTMYLGTKVIQAVAEGGSQTIWGKAGDLLTGGSSFLTSLLSDAASIVTLICLGLFALAVFLGYVLPALPFTMFMIAALGWMLSVVKGFFAAPIWMAAHSLPEGDGFAGTQARNGYMLVFSIVLRPILMLLGYLAASLVLGAMGRAIGLIGPLAIDSIQGGNVFGLISMVMYLAIFTVLMITVATRCFALSYEVPDEVLKWIGGGIESLGDSDADRNVKTGVAVVSSRVEQASGGLIAPKGADGNGGGSGKAADGGALQNAKSASKAIANE